MFQEKNLAKRRLLQATYAQRNLRFRLAHFSYWYNDFGEVTENKADSYSSFDNELQYTGAVYDDSTGLLYLNARFYDPQTGRFISRDTYRGEPNNAGTWHLYAYCANNPVNYVDPSGHYVISVGFKAEAAAIIGAYALVSINTDGKYLSLCGSVGGKVITNVAASISVILNYYRYKTISQLTGWGFSAGISFCCGLKLNGNASVDVSSKGNLSFHGGGGYGGGIGLPIPYWDTEYGYTKQYKKWKIKSISKSKKKYTVLRQKISVQRFGKYVEVKKGKRKVKIYNTGKVRVS